MLQAHTQLQMVAVIFLVSINTLDSDLVHVAHSSDEQTSFRQYNELLLLAIKWYAGNLFLSTFSLPLKSK